MSSRLTPNCRAPRSHGSSGRGLQQEQVRCQTSNNSTTDTQEPAAAHQKHCRSFPNISQHLTPLCLRPANPTASSAVSQLRGPRFLGQATLATSPATTQFIQTSASQRCILRSTATPGIFRLLPLTANGLCNLQSIYPHYSSLRIHAFYQKYDWDLRKSQVIADVLSHHGFHMCEKVLCHITDMTIAPLVYTCMPGRRGHLLPHQSDYYRQIALPKLGI